ncbi:MAG: hypothetical protein M3381_09725 [Actinomycetota bacterium]|nr:hypothetical protein [Actinomycetota bacterium]
MSNEHVDLDPQQVANGLAKWDQVAATLQSRWDSINDQIKILLTPATFGADEPGSNFQASFVEEGQAGTLKDRGQKVVTQVDETAQKVRKAAEASLAADAEQAANVGGVNVASFKTGAGSSSGSSSGGGSAMMMAEKVGEAQFVSGAGMMMAEKVGEDRFVPSDDDIILERLPYGETQSPYLVPGPETQVVAGPGGGGQYTTDATNSEVTYETPHADGASPGAGEAGGIRDAGTVGADRMVTQPVYDDSPVSQAPGGGAGEDRSSDAGDRGQGREPAGDGGDRMTTQPVDEGGSAQPEPGPGAGRNGPDGGTAAPAPEAGPADRGQDRGQGQDGGPGRQNSDGPGESFRERIADRIPDSIVERLPDGMAERIYEARGDYAVELPAVDVPAVQIPAVDLPQPIETGSHTVDVPQPIETQPVETQPVETQPVEMQGVDHGAGAVPVTGPHDHEYRTGGSEFTVERPR